jgi:hypothetical protein
MHVSFRRRSTFTALLCFALALAWGLAPRWLLAFCSVDFYASTGFVARRSAVLFLGLGVMFFSARSAPAGVARNALSSGFMVGCFGLALLGLGEWLNGNAGPGILLAVVVEAALGLGFLRAKGTRDEWATARD